MIIISHVIYVAKDMSEKCEHGRIQGKLICLDCRKVFIGEKSVLEQLSGVGRSCLS